ncbi:hypothetical protein FJY68_06840 [candidate division WOR-3 bacterium]|uniref:SbsA Ig-like domain-containing protein n=1 Tax=candidate division WOR-3 bacterium TaxID=2052148 RepID=A0A937XI87_UNCW3|nr:hypothetical protein [candidate division WOR-3 bacterium]
MRMTNDEFRMTSSRKRATDVRGPSRRVILVPLLVLAILGCRKLDNPLNPDTNLPLGTGAGNLPTVAQTEPAYRDELADDEPETTGIQATVVVAFSDYMDPDSVVKSAKVTNTSTGQVVTGLDVSYDADARRLYIRHLAWTANSAFLLTLSSSLARNRWGTSLDGNGNGKADGSPYDDALTTFYTQGSSANSCVPTRPPTIDYVDPDTVRMADTLIAVAVWFTSEMDTTTLVLSNFKLVRDDGAPVILTPFSVSPYHVTFMPAAGLSYGHRYTFTILESTVKGKAPANTPAYLLNLDTDYDGPEAAEPTLTSYFLCDTVAPPEVEAWDYADRVEFNFTVLMDTATLTPENVRVFDDLGYVPGSLVLTNDAPGNYTRVYYYFSRPLEGRLRAFVSRAVKSLVGVQLDGSGNGIGGEPWDDHWW